jgi:hypothetical protein
MVSKAKAGEILRDGEVRGRPLTKKQRGYFGLIRGGGTPAKMKSGKTPLCSHYRQKS